jgi:hypothetical protein
MILMPDSLMSNRLGKFLEFWRVVVAKLRLWIM